METYKCAMCGKIEECGSEEESEAELLAEFGDIDKSDCVKVCDDCWEKVRPSNNKEAFDMWEKANCQIMKELKKA